MHFKEKIYFVLWIVNMASTSKGQYIKEESVVKNDLQQLQTELKSVQMEINIIKESQKNLSVIIGELAERMGNSDLNQKRNLNILQLIQTALSEQNNKIKNSTVNEEIKTTREVQKEILTKPNEKEFADKKDLYKNENITTTQKNDLLLDRTTEYHNYYNSTLYVNQEEVTEIWNLVKNLTHNPTLSQSYRRALTIELSFDFPFYGQPVSKITISTSGFIYTGDYVHSWIAATQYIAPLMANFDTSLSAESFVRFHDNGTTFSVVWENVYLQDRSDLGGFTFMLTLHKSGEIVFAYYKLPILLSAIQEDKHPLKVGLSDAYLTDTVVHFQRRKTIYEYHRINFVNASINDFTLIRFTPLPTCRSYTDCVSCTQNLNTSFKCAWCSTLKRCSTGTDRDRQEWLNQGCNRTQINDFSICAMLVQEVNNTTLINNN